MQVERKAPEGKEARIIAGRPFNDNSQDHLVTDCEKLEVALKIADDHNKRAGVMDEIYLVYDCQGRCRSATLDILS